MLYTKYNKGGAMVKFRGLRKKSGFSVTELAQKLGVSIWTVYAWEGGKTKPRMDSIKALARLLNVSETELITAFEK